MALSNWFRSLFCISPISSQGQKRVRGSRRRGYKAAQEANADRSATLRDLYRAQGASTSLQGMYQQRPGPTRPPSPAYRGDGGSPMPPNPVRSPVEVTPSQNYMEPHIVTEIIARIGRAFPHIPYAVTGVAAMVHHGFTERRARKINIVCPSPTRDVIRCWAVAQGMYRVKGDPDAFGLFTSDRKFRLIDIKFIDDGFDDLTIVRGGVSQTRIAGLSSIVGEIAKGYMDVLPTATLGTQHAYSECMHWALREMIGKDKKLSRRTASTILQPEFWLPYTLSFPSAVHLFARVGLTGPTDHLGTEISMPYPDNPGPDESSMDMANSNPYPWPLDIVGIRNSRSRWSEVGTDGSTTLCNED